MTKDSICKDCISRRHGVYEDAKGVRHEENSCKNFAMAGDVSGNVKVLECSEYKKAQGGGEIPLPDSKRLHTIP